MRNFFFFFFFFFGLLAGFREKSDPAGCGPLAIVNGYGALMEVSWAQRCGPNPGFRREAILEGRLIGPLALLPFHSFPGSNRILLPLFGAIGDCGDGIP